MPNALQQRHAAGDRLLHHPQPDLLGPADYRRGLVQEVRRLPEQRAQVARRPPGLVVPALQFVEQDVEQLIGSIRFERMPAARVILAFLEQQAAQRQPVKLLLARQLARGNAFQRAQRGLPFALALLLEVQRQAAQLPFPVAQPGGDGGKRGIVVEQGLKVTGRAALRIVSQSGSWPKQRTKKPRLHARIGAFGSANKPTGLFTASPTSTIVWGERPID